MKKPTVVMAEVLSSFCTVFLLELAFLSFTSEGGIIFCSVLVCFDGFQEPCLTSPLQRALA